MAIDPKKLTDLTKVLREALKFPPEARAALASALLESLDDSVDPDDEEAWGIELRRRIVELDAGREELVRWAENRKTILGR